VTVNVWDGLEIPSLVAFIRVVPGATDAASPEAPIVATLVLLDDQAAVDVHKVCNYDEGDSAKITI